jgi:hypothetical protein
MAGFPYFDNYLTRTLSGNTSPAHRVTVHDLLRAQSRLHRFSSIWLLEDLHATSDGFWQSLMGRPDMSADAVQNLWSQDHQVGEPEPGFTRPEKVVGRQDIEAMWAAHQDVLEVGVCVLVLAWAGWLVHARARWKKEGRGVVVVVVVLLLLPPPPPPPPHPLLLQRLLLPLPIYLKLTFVVLFPGRLLPRRSGARATRSTTFSTNMPASSLGRSTEAISSVSHFWTPTTATTATTTTTTTVVMRTPTAQRRHAKPASMGRAKRTKVVLLLPTAWMTSSSG